MSDTRPASPLSADGSERRTICKAGARPNRMLLTMEMARAKTSVRRSSAASSMIDCSGGKNPGSTSAVQSENSRPSAPPASASTTLSVTSCRSTRARLAPSARRIAISRFRVVALEMTSAARFAHAMRSTRPTALMRIAEIVAIWGRNSGGIRVCRIAVIGLGAFGIAQDAEVGFGIGAGELRRDPRELGPCLAQCHAGPEPRHDRHAPVATTLGRCRRRNVRHPHVDRSSELEPAKAGWCHADDRERCAVEHHGGTDDTRVARECTPPQVVADYGDRRSGGVRVRGRNQPAERRPQAKEAEVRFR